MYETNHTCKEVAQGGRVRVACVLVTHLRAKVELLRRPHFRDTPAVIVGRERGRATVLDALPGASGAATGMTLEEALSLRPGTAVVEADEPAYRRVFRQALSSLQGVSDRVEAGDLGVAYVRLDGLSEMYGGEARLAVALLNAVPEYLLPRAGLAGGKFPAYVAARTAAAQGAVRVPVDAAAFLAPHPVDLLPVAAGVTAAMHRFGIHTLRDVASWRVEPLVDQFGAEGRLAWDLARGIDHPALDASEERGGRHRAAIPALRLRLTGAPDDGSGTVAAPRLRPARRARALRRQGRAAMLHRRGGLVGEGGPLQARRRSVGGSGRHSAGAAGVGPPIGPGGGDDHYPGRALGRVGGADGATARPTEGPP